MPRENHPSYQNHLDHGAHWGPAGSATGDHRHWFWVLGIQTFDDQAYWNDTELNRPVAVIEALWRIGQ